MTADDRRPRDPVVLLGGLTDLVEAVDDGSGLPALQLAAEVVASATGAYGATCVDYGPGGGRVVAATEAVTWLLGRPVDVSDPATAKLLAGPSVQHVTLDQLPETSARHLRGHGIQRMLMGVGSADGSSVSSLHVFFTDADGEPDPYQRAVVRLLASWAARLYRENAGLPAYPEGAEPTTAGEGLAVVGPDATVRSWSPSAERLTGRPASVAIGSALPFPVLLAIGALYALFVTADSASLTAGAVASARPGQSGATMALHSLLGFAAASLGPLVFGLALDIGGDNTAGAWFGGFAILALGVSCGPLILHAMLRTEDDERR